MRFFCIASILLGSVLSVHGQGNKNEYYNIVLPIKFDNKQYYLSDSYHPQDNYYKQEYIQKGESADKFSTMIIIDILIGNQSAKEMAMQKVAEIEKIKKMNPVVRYELYENPKIDEYMLDFLLSVSEGDRISIVEWNVYRYTPYTDKSGKKGIMLFAYSWRGYGNDVTSFFNSLKKERTNYVNMISGYQLPVIQLNK